MLTHPPVGAVRPALPRLGGVKRWAWRGPQDLHDYIADNQRLRRERRQAMGQPYIDPLMLKMMRLVSKMSEHELMDFRRLIIEKSLADQGLTKQDHMGTGFHQEHGVVCVYALNKSSEDSSELELVFTKGSDVIFRCLLDGALYGVTERGSEALYDGGYPDYFVRTDNPNADPRYLLEQGLPLRARQSKSA